MTGVPEMVERVAAVLKNLYGPLLPGHTFNLDATLILCAIREPTEAMCRVGQRFNTRLADTPPGHGQTMEIHWGDLGGTVEGYRRMIDAALSETK